MSITVAYVLMSITTAYVLAISLLWVLFLNKTQPRDVYMLFSLIEEFLLT